MKVRLIATCGLSVLLLASNVRLLWGESGDKSTTRPSTVSKWRPRKTGAPSDTIPAGIRHQSAELPWVAVLVPDHQGLTVSEQPTLFWFQSGPSLVPAVLTITEKENLQTGQKDNPNTILRLNLDPKQSGIRRVDLAHLKDLDPSAPVVRLQLDVTYEWTVALVPDPEHGAKDVYDKGLIKRVSPETAGLPESPSFSDFKQHGIWYDALRAITVMIDAHPDDKELKKERANLFIEASAAQAIQPKPEDDALRAAAKPDQQHASLTEAGK